MSPGGDERLGLGLLALLPIACCGLPILLAASIGVAAVAWGGAVVGAIAAAGLSTVFLVRRRRQTKHRHFPGADNETRRH